MTETRGRMQLEVAADELRLSGAIDEGARVSELVARAPGGRLVLDLAGVTFINSLGVRDWIRMQQMAQERHVAVELRRVSEVLIHQLNMIVATRGQAEVRSFFAPYACDKCGREDSLLIDAVADRDRLSRLDPPPQTCSECGAQMAFNDFPERYFTFLVGG